MRVIAGFVSVFVVAASLASVADAQASAATKPALQYEAFDPHSMSLCSGRMPGFCMSSCSGTGTVPYNGNCRIDQQCCMTYNNWQKWTDYAASRTPEPLPAPAWVAPPPSAAAIAAAAAAAAARITQYEPFQLRGDGTACSGGMPGFCITGSCTGTGAIGYNGNCLLSQQCCMTRNNWQKYMDWKAGKTDEPRAALPWTAPAPTATAAAPVPTATAAPAPKLSPKAGAQVRASAKAAKAKVKATQQKRLTPTSAH